MWCRNLDRTLTNKHRTNLQPHRRKWKDVCSTSHTRTEGTISASGREDKGHRQDRNERKILISVLQLKHYRRVLQKYSSCVVQNCQFYDVQGTDRPTFLPLGAPRISLPFLTSFWVMASFVRSAVVWALNWRVVLMTPVCLSRDCPGSRRLTSLFSDGCINKRVQKMKQKTFISFHFPVDA